MSEEQGREKDEEKKEEDSEPRENSSTGLDSNIGGLLSYVLGWITGLIFFLVEEKDEFVRFHAMQSIIVFGAISIAGIVLSWVPVLPILIWILGVVLWIVLMVKAYQGAMFKLPISGNLALKWTGQAEK